MYLLANAPQVAIVSELREVLTALLSDDEQELRRASRNVKSANLATVIILLCNQYDLLVPDDLIAKVRARPWPNKFMLSNLEIAHALTHQDYNQLAQAIDTLEARKEFVYAARMRIVLAKHTGDRTQLKRARPLLERLGDRQFLRRLEEVEAALAQ